jgi:hypothetical protein
MEAWLHVGHETLNELCHFQFFQQAWSKCLAYRFNMADGEVPLLFFI